MRVVVRWFLSGLCALASGVSWAQPVQCGIVLLHGKWGTAQSPYLQPVVQALEPHCQVRMLEMPWSRHRLYDLPYADALEQIRSEVQRLRQSGAQWVAVGGQSFGANATLAYMAQVGDADAVLPMAPGHVPEAFYQIPEVRHSVDAARELVASGQGHVVVEMTDINQGQRRSVRPSALALWSYFNPQGWGNMGLSAKSFQRAVPVFWAIGTQDMLYGAASLGLYNQLPRHPDSQYLVVHATHATTPQAAAKALLSWVRARLEP